jgi:hypothetical protein
MVKSSCLQQMDHEAESPREVCLTAYYRDPDNTQMWALIDPEGVLSVSIIRKIPYYRDHLLAEAGGVGRGGLRLPSDV